MSMHGDALDVWIFFLVAWGLTYIAVESVIFGIARIYFASRNQWFESFIYCAYCTGFWIGLILFAAQHWIWPRVCWEAPLWGVAVMGTIGIIRAFAPSFLEGAWDREQALVEQIRESRRRRRAGGGVGTELDDGANRVNDAESVSED